MTRHCTERPRFSAVVRRQTGYWAEMGPYGRFYVPLASPSGETVTLLSKPRKHPERVMAWRVHAPLEIVMEIWMYGDSRDADEIIWSAEDARAALEEHNWELAKQKLYDVQNRIQGLLQNMETRPNSLHEQPASERRGMLGF